MASSSNSKHLTRGWTLRQRLEHYTDKSAGPDGCWIWRASPNKEGYGRVFYEKRLHLAHRKWWEITRGAIPEGMYLCHHCDNPICVNPAHMFVGTPSDNVQDMLRKLRGPQGERQGGAKLTCADIAKIREDKRPQAVVAADYGVSQSNISMIKRGLTWGHLNRSDA